jgi:hypothetical protein
MIYPFCPSWKSLGRRELLTNDRQQTWTSFVRSFVRGYIAERLAGINKRKPGCLHPGFRKIKRKPTLVEFIKVKTPLLQWGGVGILVGELPVIHEEGRWSIEGGIRQSPGGTRGMV